MLQFSIESSRILGPCASYLNSLALEPKSSAWELRYNVPKLGVPFSHEPAPSTGLGHKIEWRIPYWWGGQLSPALHVLHVLAFLGVSLWSWYLSPTSSGTAISLPWICRLSLTTHQATHCWDHLVLGRGSRLFVIKDLMPLLSFLSSTQSRGQWISVTSRPAWSP